MYCMLLVLFYKNLNLEFLRAAKVVVCRSLEVGSNLKERKRNGKKGKTKAYMYQG